MSIHVNKKKGGWLLPLLLAIFCITTTAHANNYYVKDNGGNDTLDCGSSWDQACKTVGKALTKAGLFDVVHVAAGTYVEEINFSGFIALLGGYPAVGGDTQDAVANPTILDGNNKKRVISARMASGIIDGFTIRNGNGKSGGGIQVIECRNLQITNNYITSNHAKAGGGIFGRMNFGVEIISNTIAGNSASWHGGGINLTESDVIVVNNIIRGNTAASAGGGAYLASNNGEGSRFEANTIDANSSNRGGGLYVYDSDTLITRNNIKRNTTHATGGGLYLNDYVGTIVNCMITENHAAKGGGLYAGSSKGSIFLLNDTIADNTAGTIAPGIISYNNCLTVNNSIVWNNGQDFYGKGGFASQTIYDNDGEIIDMQTVKVPLDILITDSNISDPQYANSDPAINIMNVQPEFVGNGDYHLQNVSPCIDSVKSGVGPDIDIDGDARPLNDGFDMGADEVLPPCSPTAADDVTCDGVDDDCDGETDEEFVGTACDGNDADSCADGVNICSSGEIVCNDDSESKTEICNDNLDNDCDGKTDSVDPDCFDCQLNSTRACSTGLHGICDAGTQICNEQGGWGNCLPDTQPQTVAEVCDDHLDNDCDGEVDEDCIIHADINSDQSIDIDDVFCLFKYVMGRSSCLDNVAKPLPAYCNVNKSGSVDIDDVFCLFKHIIGRPSCMDGP